MRLLLLTMVLALAACNRADEAPARDATPPAAAPRSASLVTLLPPADARTLRFRLRAPDGYPVYLENCNGAFSWGLEHQIAGTWKAAWIVSTNACHSAPLVIAPGESREFSEGITLSAGEALPAGRYRVAIYGLYRTHDERHDSASVQVPHASRISEPFALGPLAGP